jgi:hypothetical protein
MPVAYEIHDFLTLQAAMQQFPDGAVSVGQQLPAYHVRCASVEDIQFRQRWRRLRNEDTRILLYPTATDAAPLFHDITPDHHTCLKCGGLLENPDEKAES